MSESQDRAVHEFEVMSKPATESSHRSTFFRQSGWLMVANVGGGILMWGVHFLSKKVGKVEYGLFGTLSSLVMCIPAIPLQMVMAHQAAKAIATKREREAAGMVRAVWLATFVIWLLAAVVVWNYQGRIIERWKLTNPASLWVTMVVILLSVWLPMFSGVLLGQQNFLSLGWSMISSALGRFSVAAIAVLVLHGLATGMMSGVLGGLILSVSIAAWASRSLWLTKPLPFDWRELLREIIPPLFGFAAYQFLFSADTMFVKSYFSDDETGVYVASGTLSRALIWLVGPLAAVMFPRIVHSSARAEKTDIMNVVLLGTAVLAVLGAVSLSVLAPWVVPFVFKPDYVKVAVAIIPWYVGAMVPLALGNVLLNNLLARSRYAMVPVLCALAIAYGLALTQLHGSLKMVLQTMGIFNIGLLAICGFFNWRMKVKPLG